jgi:hypothetical protein
VSFQLAIMKMLTSYRDGKASIAELKRDLAILATSGPDWTNRMKRLAARAPDLDAFSQGFLDRDGYGWWITPSGRAFLEALEKPAPPAATEPLALEVVAPAPPRSTLRPLTIVGRPYRNAVRRRRHPTTARSA